MNTFCQHNVFTNKNKGKSGVALRNLGVVSTVGEKGLALTEGDKAASHLTTLHAPGCHLSYGWDYCSI